MVKSGNQASRINVTAKIIDVNQQTETVYENYPVTLTGLINVDTPFIGLNDLIATGVSKLRGKLEGYAKNTDSGSFFIEVSGISVPSGQRVLVDLHLRVKATVKYDQCVEVPQLFSSGEECTK